MQTAEKLDTLWGRFDALSADLVRAKRRLREGRGTEFDVHVLRAEMMAVGLGLRWMGERPDATEPGD